MASTSPSARRRRPLLYLLIAGFVVGVVWLTRAVWRPLRGRGAVSPVRDLTAPRPGPVMAPPAAPVTGPDPAAVVDAPPPAMPFLPAVPATAAPVAIGDDVSGPVGPAPGEHPLDDLTRIEGIGRRMAAALVDEGISTFDALGLASPAQLRAALANQGLRFAPALTTWPEQARLLADGDEAGFAQLSARLRRGAAST